MDWKESKLRVVVWITLAMLVDAGLVLWPLGSVLKYTGVLSISVSVIIFVAVGLVSGLIIGLVAGLSIRLVHGLIIGLVVSLSFGLIIGLGADLSTRLVHGTVIGLAYGLVGGLGFGLILGLSPFLGRSLVAGLVIGIVVGLIIGIVYGFGVRLISGLVVGLSLFAGTLFGVLLCYWFRELFKGGVESVKQFFTPWRSERLYFGHSVGFFVMLYMVFVLLFALWFYASYLNAARELPTPTVNSYFKTQDISPTSNFWTFVYFSFITISLGYGDIYPTHWFSQILVIAETMIGVGMVAGFLALIMNVGGRGKAKQVE